MNWELLDVQAGFQRGRGFRDQIAKFIGSWRKQRSSRKPFTTASLTMLKPLIVWNTTDWKILQEMGLPDHLTCLLRNLYAVQEAAVRTERGTTGSDLRKEYDKAYTVTLLFQLIFRVHHVKCQANRLDSRLEGHELTASYKNTKMSTYCWTTISNNNNKILEPTIKDTLHPMKKKPQWDNRRGTIRIKSFPATVHEIRNWW